MGLEKQEVLPITVIMITLNEAHNIDRIAKNLKKVSEIIILDSFSADNTVDKCLEYGFRVYQRPFDGFGSQWNAALKIPISNSWVMKLDPDESISDELFNSIKHALISNEFNAYKVIRQLTFMGKPLNVYDEPLRIWKAGKCIFSEDLVNEHPIVIGKLRTLKGILYHHDSPNLEHWFYKQNKYSSKEGIERMNNKTSIILSKKLLRSQEIRRKWIKKYFWYFPFKYSFLFLYLLFIKGAFKSGLEGYLWVKSRIIVYKLYDLKYKEIRHLKLKIYPETITGIGKPNPKCPST